MDTLSLSKLNFKPLQQPFSISLQTNPSFPFSKPSTISFPKPLKIKSLSTHQNPKPISPIVTLLKTPLTIAVASTAIFLSSLAHKPPPALASPPLVQETTNPATTQSESETETPVSDAEREKKLEDYVAAHPDDVQGYKSLMEVKIKNKKLPEAVEALNRLIELEPEELEWYLLRAHMYTYMGETELAKDGFEEIISKDPIRVEAFHGLVMAVSQGEDQSSAELKKIVGRIEDALEKCRKAKKMDDVRDFKLLIAQVRVIEGSYEEALKVYEELVKEEPRDFRPYLCQGIIYTLLRKKDEAEKQFDKYKRLVPQGHPYAKYFDDNMFATKVFSQMGENERVKMGAKS